jgi:uncharacterized protein YqhQ
MCSVWLFVYVDILIIGRNLSSPSFIVAQVRVALYNTLPNKDMQMHIISRLILVHQDSTINSEDVIISGSSQAKHAVRGLLLPGYPMPHSTGTCQRHLTLKASMSN